MSKRKGLSTTPPPAYANDTKIPAGPTIRISVDLPTPASTPVGAKLTRSDDAIEIEIVLPREYAG